MNGVAKQYWNEVFDLHAPVDDDHDDDRGRPSTTRKKQVRRVAPRRARQGRSAA